jgi:hypothetical protein
VTHPNLLTRYLVVVGRRVLSISVESMFVRRLWCEEVEILQSRKASSVVTETASFANMICLQVMTRIFAQLEVFAINERLVSILYDLS